MQHPHDHRIPCCSNYPHIGWTPILIPLSRLEAPVFTRPCSNTLPQQRALCCAGFFGCHHLLVADPSQYV